MTRKKIHKSKNYLSVSFRDKQMDDHTHKKTQKKAATFAATFTPGSSHKHIFSH
jgi:hypothetical protein